MRQVSGGGRGRETLGEGWELLTILPVPAPRREAQPVWAAQEEEEAAGPPQDRQVVRLLAASLALLVLRLSFLVFKEILTTPACLLRCQVPAALRAAVRAHRLHHVQGTQGPGCCLLGAEFSFKDSEMEN